MDQSRDHADQKCRPWARRFAAFLLIAIRHSSTWIIRVFLILLLLLFGLFAYLHLVGVPAYLTDLFLDRMAHRGYPLQIERLTLEIDRGLVARDIRLFASPESPEPFLTAEALTVALDPAALWREQRAVPVLAITGGTLRAHLGHGRLEASQGSRSILIEAIHLRFTASDQEILLRDFSAAFLGIQFRGRGAAYPAPREDPPVPAPAGFPNPLAATVAAIEQAPEWLVQMVEQVNAIRFDSPPSADFTFALYPAHPEANIAAFHLQAPAGGRIRDIEFDQVALDVAWKNQRIQVHDLHLRRGSDTLGLSGWLAVTNQTVSLHLVNTLTPDVFLDLLPDPIRQQALDLVPDFQFPVRVDVQIGPAPLASAVETASGRITLSGARVKDVPIHSLDLSFVRNGREIQVLPSVIQLDAGPGASRVNIREGHFLLDTLRFEARVAGTLNPHLIKPWMTPNMRNIVGWFGIEEPLEGALLIGGTVGDRAIYCQGPVQATNITIHGVAVQSVHGQLNITNEVMHIIGATLVRPEGTARGDVHMAFSNQTLRMSVDSLLDPRATAEMMGPVVADFMEPFLLNGPARVQAEGLLDYCNFSLNRLRAHVQAERFGFDLWEADTALFDLEVVGRRIRFTNAVATAYGGTVAGHGVFYPVGNDLQWRYEADLTAAEVRLNDLLAASFERPMGDLRGALSGRGVVGGYLGPGTGPSVTGTGEVEIRNGLLFQTKLFSGLAAILDKVLPDFTLFAQTDARGTYAIRNSQVHSRDIELQGSLFSVMASGRYAFDGDLRYRVEVQPLRGGPVAALLRLATRPVTRLLEFRLTGTFEDPRWRPVNLNLAELFD